MKERESVETLPLRESVSRGAIKFISLGFHNELYSNLDDAEASQRYLADFTLAHNADIPTEYTVRFGLAVVVDPRIELSTQLSKVRVEHLSYLKNFSVFRVQNPSYFPKRRPYVIFTHDGRKYTDYSIDEARMMFADDETGLTPLELTAVYLQHPEFFHNQPCGLGAAGYELPHRNDITYISLARFYNPVGEEIGGIPVFGRWTEGYDNPPSPVVLSRGRKALLLGRSPLDVLDPITRYVPSPNYSPPFSRYSPVSSPVDYSVFVKSMRGTKFRRRF